MYWRLPFTRLITKGNDWMTITCTDMPTIRARGDRNRIADRMHIVFTLCSHSW